MSGSAVLSDRRTTPDGRARNPGASPAREARHRPCDSAGHRLHGLAWRLDRSLPTHLARPGGAADGTDVVPLHPPAADGSSHRDHRWTQGRTDFRSPFVRALLFEPQHRIPRLIEAFNAIARIILLGLVMDVIYQLIAFHRFYPAEAVIIALLLAVVPYLVLRGLITRGARRWWHAMPAA